VIGLPLSSFLRVAAVVRTDLPEMDLHGHVKQIRVSVTHPVLAEQDRDHLGAGGRVRQPERFVLEVGAQTLRVHFDRVLRRTKDRLPRDILYARAAATRARMCAISTQ